MTEEVARSLPVTQWAIAEMQPFEWQLVADYLSGMLNKNPLRESPDYGPHRLVLGALAAELRQNAIAAGEPPSDPIEAALWIETQQWRNSGPEDVSWRLRRDGFE